MLIRVLSDVHSNLPALAAVLADSRGLDADLTVCLGDVVGYGAEPTACIGLVREACTVTVSGNHDSGVAGKTPLHHFNSAGAEAVTWTRGTVGAGDMEWLAGLPLHAELGDLFLCHSDPAAPGGWRYILTRSAAVDAIEALQERIGLVGHTHLPGVWSPSGDYSEAEEGRMEGPLLINCGSVGQPRDGDARAAFMILDTTAGTWRHLRVGYDVDASAAAIRGAGLPGILADRLFTGR